MVQLAFKTYYDLTSIIIRLGERDGWATHCEFRLPDGRWLGSQTPEGVMIRPADYDAKHLRRQLIVNVRVPGEDLMYKFLHDQIGKPYDYLGVLGLGLGTDWREEGAWFCSELAARALELGGAFGFNELVAVDNHISPRDLLLVLSGKQAIPDGVENVRHFTAAPAASPG